MKKNIIISGCSMSSDVTSLDKNQKENSENHNYLHWPHFLDSTNKNFYVINASRDGADNGTIFRNLKHIFKQNSSKRDWSDTIVFVQWSAVDRHSIYVEEEQKWILSSTHTDSDHIFEEYYKNEYTEEKALQNTLDNISNAEKFLKSKGVKYRMFFGWNVLDDDVDFKVNDIDTSKFWFHSGEHWNSWEKGDSNVVKYGGINEWVRENVSEDLWSRTDEDKHPSNEAQMQVCNQVIYKLILDLEKE